MKHKALRFGKGFNVVLGNRRSRAAQMVLTPGESEGSSQNRHRGSDQWLLVIRGTGTAIVNGRPPISAEDAVIRFLDGDVISRWADMTLGR